MTTKHINPFVIWAGGKRQLLEPISHLVPEEFDTYYEPFVGGGALLFFLQPKKAVINDSNETLINVYRQLRDNYDDLWKEVKTLDAFDCDKDWYRVIRATFNAKITKHEMDAQCAALFLWLNKRCYNGLYRVNNQGLFNVPYNPAKKDTKSLIESNAIAVSEYLQNNEVTILCEDFETSLKGVSKNDFVYFDSPYVPVSDTAMFTKYTKEDFKYSDHCRLAELFNRLTNQEIKSMLSNHDVPLVHKLYEGHKIRKLNVRRTINCKGNKRTGKEVLITNYEESINE